MLCPVIQKVIFSKKAFVERRLPEADQGKFLVKRGDKVLPFDFVAEIKDTVRQRLTAGVGGEVVKLIPGKALLVQTSAVIVRGIVGSGPDSEGEVRIAASGEEPLKLEAIEVGCAGNILVGGYVPALEVFKKAEAVGVKGIVCGGADFACLQKTALPTLLTEGFGRPPLNRNAFEFLKRVEGRHVFLSPDHGELLVARHSDGEESHSEFLEAQPEEVTEPFAELKEGMGVQVFDFDHFGQIGKAAKVLADTVEVLLDPPEADVKITVSGRNLGIIK